MVDMELHHQAIFHVACELPPIRWVGRSPHVVTGSLFHGRHAGDRSTTVRLPIGIEADSGQSVGKGLVHAKDAASSCQRITRKGRDCPSCES